jgi:hypothetical protein
MHFRGYFYNLNQYEFDVPMCNGSLFATIKQEADAYGFHPAAVLRVPLRKLS